MADVGDRNVVAADQATAPLHIVAVAMRDGEAHLRAGGYTCCHYLCQSRALDRRFPGMIKAPGGEDTEIDDLSLADQLVHLSFCEPSCLDLLLEVAWE